MTPHYIQRYLRGKSIVRQFMSDKPTSSTPYYEIRLKGHLDARWGEQFEGLVITLDSGDTLLSGPVADQAALHGLLKKVRDLGMPLVSISQFTQREPAAPPHEEKKMKISATPAKKLDTKALLSTLWIVVMLNMLKADILSLFIPGAAEEVTRTATSTGASIPQLMLVGAVMGNLAIAMVILSRGLKHKLNRWVNIIVGVVTIAYIWGGMSFYPHYIFIATVETLCLLLIIGFAWTWRNPET